jgi:hypothetical protein
VEQSVAGCRVRGECGCRHKLFLSYIRTQSKLSDQDVIYGYVSFLANDPDLPNNALGHLKLSG